MAINITPDQVREICGTTYPDNVIQLYIDSVNNKIGDCLEMSYDPATAELIMLNLIAHMVCGNSTGQKTSVKAPNGASVNYSTVRTRGGLRSSPYGEMAYLLDTNGCWQNLFANSFMLEVVGN